MRGIVTRTTKLTGASHSTPRAPRRCIDQPRLREGRIQCRAIRGIQTFDGSFELKEEAREALLEMLDSETFAKQVQKECHLEEGSSWEFTGDLFQPVPWSRNNRKGMPQEFEGYLEDPSYTVINIPPTMMFKAKILNPSRLCAVFKRMT